MVEGDAGDPDVLEAVFSRHEIDSVVHFAARKSVAESVGDPLGYYRSNLGSTTAVAAAAVERGVGRLVFSSSASVYGSTTSLPVTEDSPTFPESPYGATKLMGERILADAAAASELTAVMLRYFNPVGAHPSGPDRGGSGSVSRPTSCPGSCRWPPAGEICWMSSAPITPRPTAPQCATTSM